MAEIPAVAPRVQQSNWVRATNTTAASNGLNQAGADNFVGSDGVGGDLIFKIGLVHRANGHVGVSSKPGEFVQMELAPARASFFDRQGQRVPGAGAGLDIRARANLAKLNVPGSRPIYQHMGIAEETLEWVGAFAGMDHGGGAAPSESYKDPQKAYSESIVEKYSGWVASQNMANIFRRGRELAIWMEWGGRPETRQNHHTLAFQGKALGSPNHVWFTGYIKEFQRWYATEQKVYYRIVFAITNRQDTVANRDEKVEIALPEAFSGGAAGVTTASQSAIGRQQMLSTGSLTQWGQEALRLTKLDAVSIPAKPAGVNDNDVATMIGTVNKLTLSESDKGINPASLAAARSTLSMYHNEYPTNTAIAAAFDKVELAQRKQAARDVATKVTPVTPVKTNSLQSPQSGPQQRTTPFGTGN